MVLSYGCSYGKKVVIVEKYSRNCRCASSAQVIVSWWLLNRPLNIAQPIRTQLPIGICST